MAGQWLTVDGTDGHFASTPDHADFDMASDLEIRVRVSLTDLPPVGNNEVVFSNFSFGDTIGYLLQIQTDGVIQAAWGDGAANLFREAGTISGWTAGIPRWLRLTVDVDNGSGEHKVDTYDSLDDTNDHTAVSWTSLGDRAADTGTTTIANPTAVSSAGGDGQFATVTGRLFVAVVLDGLGGSEAGHFNADDFTLGDADTDTAVDATGKTWTINGTNSLIEGPFVSVELRGSIPIPGL